ncbi:MAG: hypothetical protein Q9213_002570 [Squamulea squamosa]
MTQFRTNEDYRLSSGTHAPEIDHDLQAPESRYDNSAPELDPAQGVQVFYDRHPPEAVAIDSLGDTSDEPTKTATRKPRTQLVSWFLLLAIVSIAIALGVGLGVGLKRSGTKDASETPTPPASAIASHSSIATTSTAAPTSATSATHTDPMLQHGMLDNTSLAAVTFPNDNRHVYFQEKTGAFRRATYSSQAKLWQAASDPHLPPDVKNSTPLAAVTGLNVFQIENDGSYVFREPDDYNVNVVTLFYVNGTNHIRCVDWDQKDTSSCSLTGLSILPNIPIAPNSRQISAAILVSDKDERGLLLTYQDLSHRSVIMLGFVEHKRWTWQNETGKLNSAQTQDFVTNACSIGLRHVIMAPDTCFLYCFAKSSQDGSPQMAIFDIEFTSPKNFTLTAVEYTLDKESRVQSIADVAPLAQGHVLFLNQSKLDRGAGPLVFGAGVDLPLSSPRFPFEHLASTFANDSNSTYVYHQLSDTILAEELWDGTSGFWISNNITIQTS